MAGPTALRARRAWPGATDEQGNLPRLPQV